jgi:hypothetical protein
VIDPSYFEKKRQQLGMDRGDALAVVQGWLDQHYPAQTRAKQLHQGVLRVVTPNASVATDLRMRQMELLEVACAADASTQRLVISIEALR